MNAANFKQKILSSAAGILLALYNVVALSLIVIVMIWHRAWKLQPRKR